MPATPCASPPLSGIAAKNLEGGLGIASRTIASLVSVGAGPRTARFKRCAGNRRGRHDRHTPDRACSVPRRARGFWSAPPSSRRSRHSRRAAERSHMARISLFHACLESVERVKNNYWNPARDLGRIPKFPHAIGLRRSGDAMTTENNEVHRQREGSATPARRYRRVGQPRRSAPVSSTGWREWAECVRKCGG